MKVAIVSNGAQSLLNFRGPLIAEMVRLGHKVFAFAPDHSEATRQALQALGATPVDYGLSRAGFNPFAELLAIVSLKRLLSKLQPDLCFTYFIKPVLYGSIAAWLAGVPARYGMIEGLGFAFTESSGQSQSRKLLQRVITLLARFACKRITKLIFLNPDDQAEFIDRGIVLQDKSILLGAIGLDLLEWQPTSFVDGPLSFVLIARLLKDKGISEYIAAAQMVQAQHPQARCILVGGHDANPAAISLKTIEAAVDAGIIEWVGQTDVKPWLQCAHVFVLPSYREGVPRSTQEAMAMGRPVITTDVPGCRETVVEGVNGFLVPARDPQALAEAMMRFVDNPDLIAAMGHESRQLAEQRFDVHVQNTKLIRMMQLDIERTEDNGA